MEIGDYKFKVGDEVITVNGERGEIVYICECERCQERGFCEPVWRNDYDDSDEYITDAAAERGFNHYYKIGDYLFNNKFNRNWVEHCISIAEDRLTQLRKQLQLIDEIEGAKKSVCGTTVNELLSEVDYEED